jgi:hypothetical protein
MVRVALGVAVFVAFRDLRRRTARMRDAVRGYGVEGHSKRKCDEQKSRA